MSEKNILEKEISDVLGLTGTLFIVWDKNKKLITADKITKCRIEKLFSSTTHLLNYEHFFTTLHKKNILTNVQLGQILSNFKNSTKSEKCIPYICNIKLLTDHEETEIILKRTNSGSIISIFKEVDNHDSLKKELETLRSAISKAPLGIMLYDEQEKLIFASDKTIEKGKEFGFNFIPGASRTEARLAAASQIEISEELTNEEWVTQNKSQWTTLKGSQARIRKYKNGTVELVEEAKLENGNGIIFNIDITDHKNQMEISEQFRTAIDEAPFRITLWDKHDTLLLANKFTIDQMSNYGVEFIPGKITKQDQRKAMFDLNIVKSVDGIPLSESLHGANTIDTTKKESREVEFRNGEILLNKDVPLKNGGTITFGTDITELKSRESSLQRLQEAIKEVPGPIRIILWDKDDKLLMTNKFVEERMKEFGLKIVPGETTGNEYRQFLLNNDLIKSINAEQITGRKMPSSYKIERNEGANELREIEFINGEIVLIDDGLLADGTKIQIGTDITERKNKEKNLLRLEEAIEEAPLRMALFDENNRLVLANRDARERMAEVGFNMIPGITTDAERKKYLAENGIVKKINGKLVNSELPIADIIKNEDDESLRVREVEMSNGEHFLMESTYLNDGSHITFGLDITELKNQTIIANRLKSAIDEAPFRMTLWDENETLYLANKYTHNLMSKYDIEFISGKTTLNDQRLQQTNKQAVLRINEDSTSALSDGTMVRVPDTRVVEFREGEIFLNQDIHLQDGGIITFGTDITELKKKEDELKKSKIEADQANEAKSQFLANMSHELRTPLNAVIGLTEMLKEDAEDDGYDDYIEPLDRIHVSGRHLLSLINDVLDLSKIEAGKIELHYEEFSVSDLLKDISNTTQPLTEKNNNVLTLSLDIDRDTIVSDFIRVKQILLNLVSNAAKFTSDGSIDIQIKRLLEDSTELLQISVTDTGIGMSEEQVEKLFEAFTQADSSTTRQYGGTGLGLSITKHLCRLLGGDVAVTSEEGKGTCFTATILTDRPHITDGISNPTYLADKIYPNNQTPETQFSSSEFSILVIDDDPTIRALVERHLVKSGYTVILADNGKAGIELARKHIPDAVILDILMPDFDGWSVLRTLKADSTTSHIPVVLASILDERNTGFSLGAADYLTKPVEKDNLLRSIQNLLGHPNGQVILTVEDDPELQYLIKESLNKAGYKVEVANDGLQALEVLRSLQCIPSLILLDLIMPRMNGFEFIEKFRTEFDINCPIVVVTGKDLSDDDKIYLAKKVESVLDKSTKTRLDIIEEVNSLISSLALEQKDE